MSGTFPTTVYFDDFPSPGDYTHLNALWSVYNSAGNAGYGLRRPAQVSIVGGVAGATSDGNVMRITAANVGGVHQSGGIQLNVPQTYGQYEMRVRVSTDASQVTSGVCLLWPQDNLWPEHGELDFWETYGHRDTRTPVQSYIHRPSSVPETTVEYDHTGISQAAWHKIVCNWTPDEVSIGIDDGAQILLTGVPSYIPSTPMQLCLQLDAWSDTPPTTPVTMDVDYVVVRSYSPVTATASGLPRLGFNTPTTVAAPVGAGDSIIPITPNTALPTTGIYPVSLDLAGEMVTVAGAAVSGANLNLTGCTRAVNGVVRSHAVGDKVRMANPFKLSMGKAIGHTGRVIGAGATKFNTTAALVASELAPGGQVLSWMPCNPSGGVDTRRDADWEQGQFSTFTNADTAPSYGFWYPNTGTGGPAYANSDYMFVASPGQAFSGSGFAKTIITGDTYSHSYAAQLWRTLLQSGAEMTAINMNTFYMSWRVRYMQTITYDNHVDGYTPPDGFRNDVQVYANTSASGDSPIFLSLAAGQNLAYDSRMRWHISLNQRLYWDIPMTSTEGPVIPIGNWIHMEVFFVISDGFDGRTGRLKVWQDGVQFIDFTGTTISDYWEKFGVSWGNYGHLMGQTTCRVDYDECLLSTVGTVDRLSLPQPTGGLG